MIKRIETIARERGERFVEQRNYLRQHPELGLTPETAQYLSEKLIGLGFEVKEGVAETGLVATLAGQKEAKVIAFKGNMDGVPVEDGVENESLRSKVSGVSHTCGHAGEMAAMLGAAEILSQIPTEERGTLKLIFQPNEERLWSPESYALKMVNEGALRGVDAIVEFHPTTLVAENTFRCPEGRFNAASGRYKVMVYPQEQDVMTGKSPDAHTILSLITARMGKYEPRPEQLGDILVRTPFQVSKKETLKVMAEKWGVSPEQFISFKITLKGPGGHAGVSKEAPNLNLLSSQIVSELYNKYGNSLLSFSESAGKPAYNVLTTQTDLWLTLRGGDRFNEFQKDVARIVRDNTRDLPVEKEYHQEEIERVPFATQTESYSTIRVGEDDYQGPRKNIFSDLRKVLMTEMKDFGLTKPESVKGAGEKMQCSKGEWRVYYSKGTPPQFNSSELVKVIEQAAQEFGITKINKESITAGSDFCYMQKPGIKTALVTWGCVSLPQFEEYKRQNIGHHHPRFIESPESIIRTAKILARVAEIFWEKNIIGGP
jgi:metal-dependent amidase/aminoacylase/carboxypeptidase family protein